MPRIILCSIIIVLVALLASADAQTAREPRLSAGPSRAGSAGGDELVARLEEQIRSLELRVQRLEAREALESPTLFDDDDEPESEDRPAAASGGRVLYLDGVDSLEPDPALYEELERLRDEERALARTVESKEHSVASMHGRGGRGGSYRSGRGAYVKDTSHSRRRRAEGELLADYRTSLRRKRGEVRKLERDIEEPKQIIHGHQGTMIITLKTTRDLSRMLDRVELGEALTWTGRRMRGDATSHEWVVSSIERADDD